MPINLTNSTPIVVGSRDNAGFLSKLQGNILRGHGRDMAIYTFARFKPDAGLAREHLQRQAERLTSALQQHRDEIAFRETRVAGPTFRNLFLSATGYAGLGFSDDDVRTIAHEPPDNWVKSNFAEGMKAHGAELSDPPVDTWDPAYRGPIDLLIVLADDDEQRLADAATALAAELEPFAEIVNVEHGKALRSQNADGFEHFGFIDGRSQPIFAQEHLVDDGPHTAWDPFEPLGLVLVRDKGVPDDEEALGSFFVFRKLEQNVRGFIERERELVAELQLPSGDRERVGAMLLGRFRDGTPLVNHSSGGQAPNDNDFAFDNANTHRCPFHAHVRKANPRGDVTVRSGQEGREMERDRRIVRRGIPYGAATTRPNASVESLATLPSDGVGLLFGCFQAHIARQFGHIQKLWFNNPGFPVDGAGVDGLMAAQPSPTPLNWLRKWGESPTHSSPFGEFVKLKGGEFFFAPSIPFVRGLRR